MDLIVLNARVHAENILKCNSRPIAVYIVNDLFPLPLEPAKSMQKDVKRQRLCLSQNSSPRARPILLSRPQSCTVLFISHSSQSCVEFELFPYVLPPAKFMVSIDDDKILLWNRF